jgi:hypothetical protein
MTPTPLLRCPRRATCIRVAPPRSRRAEAAGPRFLAPGKGEHRDSPADPFIRLRTRGSTCRRDTFTIRTRVPSHPLLPSPQRTCPAPLTVSRSAPTLGVVSTVLTSPEISTPGGRPARLHQCHDRLRQIEPLHEIAREESPAAGRAERKPGARNLVEVIGYFQRADGFRFVLFRRAASDSEASCSAPAGKRSTGLLWCDRGIRGPVS